MSHKILAGLIALLPLLNSAVSFAAEPESDSTLKEHLRVAVVSCAKIKSVCEQEHWDTIRSKEPDLLLILGDIVYLDKKHRRYSKLKKCISRMELDINKQKILPVEDIFTMQWSEKHFSQLIKEVPYFATWDDHDAGTNNIRPMSKKDPLTPEMQAIHHAARESFVKRIYNREALNLYSDIGINKIALRETGDVAITNTNNFEAAKTLDYSFAIGDVQFLMLDGISSRSDVGTTILSESQLAWLDKKLTSHNKGITILSTGASLELSEDDWGWKNAYNKQYQQLRTIINKHSNVLVLAGDIHKNATVPPAKDGLLKAYELVSSGIAYRDTKGKSGNFLMLDIVKTSDEVWNIKYNHTSKKSVQGGSAGNITLSTSM